MNRLQLDQTATIAGCAAGIGVLTQVDFDKLAMGHWGELTKVLIGAALCVLGIVTNRKEKT